MKFDNIGKLARVLAAATLIGTTTPSTIDTFEAKTKSADADTAIIKTQSPNYRFEMVPDGNTGFYLLKAYDTNASLQRDGPDLTFYIHNSSGISANIGPKEPVAVRQRNEITYLYPNNGFRVEVFADQPNLDCIKNESGCLIGKAGYNTVDENAEYKALGTLEPISFEEMKQRVEIARNKAQEAKHQFYTTFQKKLSEMPNRVGK